jgi:hypothetical protein
MTTFSGPLTVKNPSTDVEVEVFTETGKLGENATAIGNGQSILDSNGNSWIKASIASSAVNTVQIGNAATEEPLTISATGTDSDIDLQLFGKGASGAVEVVKEDDGALGAVLNLRHVTASAAVSDIAGRLEVTSKDNAETPADVTYGRIDLQLFAVTAGSPESTWGFYVQDPGGAGLVQPLLLGYDAVQIGVSGADAILQPANNEQLVLKTVGANKDVSIEPHGTGKVKFGTHAAVTTETLSGFITMKDAGGTERKLAIVS